MTADRPGDTAGLRHVSLRVRELERCVAFYTEHLGLEVEWRPDDDTVFLTSGHESLALQRAEEPATEEAVEPATHGTADGAGPLDHLGFLVDFRDDVDRWHAYLREQGVEIAAPPKDHRDGSRSFFCRDPAGTEIQMFYHPKLSRS